MQEQPIEFRCDSMSVLSGPNRNLCRHNVVIRRGDLVVCCEQFEGVADEAWQWQRFVCRKDVRARRGADTIWAEEATFFAAGADLVLQGKPILQRGDSILQGERVRLNMRDDRAHITRPIGSLQSPAAAATALPIAASGSGPLPATCPIGPFGGAA
ncbi:MAG: hypothetical protein EOO40_05990 [Deltaproteobacteria bacterium]|nr:MAG: hypothetical protein EOO40_05990 [Deltaproteobacteria bacterium]